MKMRRTLLAALSLLAAFGCQPPEPGIETPPDTVFVTDTVTVVDTVLVPDTVLVTDTLVLTDTVTVTDTVVVVDTVFIEEPSDTAGPVPDTVSLSGLPDTLTLGDTVSVTGALLDADGDEISTAPFDWDVNIMGGLRYAADSALTNVVRAAEAGPGSVRYTHLGSGLVSLVTTEIQDTTIPEPPDTIIGEASRPDPVAGWPLNEPAGMTPIFFADGSTKQFADVGRYGARWLDEHFVEVVPDPESKYGLVIEKRSFVGDPSGWHGFFTMPMGGAWNELYIRMVVKLSSNYQWHTAGEKWWFLRGWGNLLNTDRHNAVPGGDQRMRISLRSGMPRHETAIAVRHIAAPQEGLPAIDRGRYVTLEVYSRRNPGCYRAWIDGVEIERWWPIGSQSDENFPIDLCPTEWGSTRPYQGTMEMINYWGGQGDVKRVDDYMRISEIYISAKP